MPDDRSERDRRASEPRDGERAPDLASVFRPLPVPSGGLASLRARLQERPARRTRRRALVGGLVVACALLLLVVPPWTLGPPPNAASAPVVVVAPSEKGPSGPAALDTGARRQARARTAIERAGPVAGAAGTHIRVVASDDDVVFALAASTRPGSGAP